MPDLFIKRRKEDGTFGVLEPAIKGGKTTEDKLQEQIDLNTSLMMAFVEMVDKQENDKLDLHLALAELAETMMGANE